MKALKKFVKFLLTKTSFIRIETTNVTDALKIFETINQRGKGLDSMDLLKNRLFIMPSSIRLRRMSPSALLFPGVPNSAPSGSFRSLMHSLSTLSSPWLQTGNRTTCPISCGLV